MSIVALIPARSGSKRIPDKNVKPLAGHPLMAYTIAAARQSGIFDEIVVSTDSAKYGDIAYEYGADLVTFRPGAISDDTSPDIEWVEHTISKLPATDMFAILRPTSPFRQYWTIVRAYNQFISDACIDSIRAVELCSQHPGKMWVVNGNRMSPVLPYGIVGCPWHSNQYAALPKIFVQNASLEIAHIQVLSTGTISGYTVAPFFTKEYEGFDINTPRDWDYAEQIIKKGGVVLPEIEE